MNNLRFVLDRHSAIKRGLHWDLRFSMPNSKNWASFSMNKFPPLEPGESIYVPRSNDHSPSEATFIGKIPEGKYGAGTIIREDEGECIIHKFTNAHIVIEFKGKKLKGIYHLINVGTFGRRRQYNKKLYKFFKGRIK